MGKPYQAGGVTHPNLKSKIHLRQQRRSLNPKSKLAAANNRDHFQAIACLQMSV